MLKHNLARHHILAAFPIMSPCVYTDQMLVHSRCHNQLLVR